MNGLLPMHASSMMVLLLEDGVDLLVGGSEIDVGAISLSGDGIQEGVLVLDLLAQTLGQPPQAGKTKRHLLKIVVELVIDSLGCCFPVIRYAAGRPLVASRGALTVVHTSQS